VASLDVDLDAEILKTSALQTLTTTHTTDIASNTADILTKQDLINTSTDLTANSITLSSLNVNGNINLDTTTHFNTIVIRRLDETDLTLINLNELQVWVNGSNILFPNSTSLTGYFALWANKKNNIGFAYWFSCF
jgi:hypothetical protein